MIGDDEKEEKKERKGNMRNCVVRKEMSRWCSMGEGNTCVAFDNITVWALIYSTGSITHGFRSNSQIANPAYTKG
jgi:hypothetical protein